MLARELRHAPGALEEREIEPVSSGFEWVPKNPTTLGEEEAEEVRSLFERLKQDDDVQEVFSSLA